MIYIILIAHFIADFLFQSDKMSKGKSEQVETLFYHTFIYSCVFVGIFMIGMYFTTTCFGQGWTETASFAAVIWFLVFLPHTIIDGFSSQLTKYFYKKEKRHWFFVTIGADQLLHYACLFWLYQIITL